MNITITIHNIINFRHYIVTPLYKVQTHKQQPAVTTQTTLLYKPLRCTMASPERPAGVGEHHAHPYPEGSLQVLARARGP